MLVVAAALFVATFWLPDDEAWVGYVQATLEASLVGGLADWFAVTALFRHPLGLPIPHTAIVPERKDQFGETLGDFVQHSFLTPAIIVDRVRGAQVVERLADWLSNRRTTPARVAGHAADVVVAGSEAFRDDDVHRTLDDAIRTRVDAVPLAPLAGRALDLMTAGGRHHEVLDLVLRGADRYLDENRVALRLRFEREAPWWMPEAVEDRIFDRLLDGVRRERCTRSLDDPDHELRHDFDQRVHQLAEDLRTSPEMYRTGRAAQARAADPAGAAPVVVDAVGRPQGAAADAGRRSRTPSSGGGWPTPSRASASDSRTTPRCARRLQDGIETGVRYVAEHFHDEIGAMVSSTIARWDADETSRRLELLLGPDLQFIRINGTVVGGLAGLAIHTITQVLT